MFALGLLTYENFSELGIDYGVDEDFSVAAGIANQKLDCYESAIPVAGILSAKSCAAELIRRLRAVGTCFFKIDQTNLDQGRSVSDGFYLKKYSLEENSSALTPLSLEARAVLHYWVQGNMYYEAELYDLAQKSYQKAMLLSPDNSQFTYGITYNVLQNYDKATLYYLKAAHLGQRNFELLENLSAAYQNLAQKKLKEFFQPQAWPEPLQEQQAPLSAELKSQDLELEK